VADAHVDGNGTNAVSMLQFIAAVRDLTKGRLKTMARRLYFAALIVICAIVTWDATVGARRPGAQTARPSGGNELSCEMPQTGARSLQMLGRLPEASGLAMSRRSPSLLWSINDSDDPTVIALSTAGEVQGEVRVTGAAPRDWEAVSAGPCPGGSCLYVGDIGDDGAKRMQVIVYRVPEPRADDRMTAQADTFVFAYPDSAHDAESLVVAADQSLFVITKGHPTVLYRAPRDARPGTTAMLTRVAELPIEKFLNDHARKSSRITDAATTPDGEWIALRTNSELLLLRTRDLVNGKMSDVWHANLRALDETQGEGVAISNAGDVYLAGEGGGRGLPGTFTHVKCQLPR
jgi:hypothetical protein